MRLNEADQFVLGFLAHGQAGAIAFEAVAAVEVAGACDSEGQGQAAVPVEMRQRAHLGDVVKRVVPSLFHQKTEGAELQIQHGAAGIIKRRGIGHNPPDGGDQAVLHRQKSPDRSHYWRHP